MKKIKNVISLLLTTMLFLILVQCKSVQVMDSSKRYLADSGELTRQELEGPAKRFSDSIAEHFSKKNLPNGIFVALLPTKNDTSEEIPIKVFDSFFVDGLRKKGIYTVRTEDRSTALKEIEFNMSGLAESSLSVGKMKSPNYFIKVDISESAFRQGKGRILEQTFNAELRNVETQNSRME